MDKLTLKNTSADFVNTIKDFLLCKKYEKCMEYINDAGNAEVLEQGYWELVPVLVDHLTEETKIRNTELFDTVLMIFNFIAEKCNPAETVLLFLEQIENFDNDVRFQALLKPLATCLSIANLSQVIEWIVSTIKAYVEGLPVPENKKIDSKVKEIDPVVVRLICTYDSIQLFLQQLVTSNDINIPKVHSYIMHLYLCLLGKPFSLLNNDSIEKIGLISLALIEQMCRLNSNPLKFSYIIEDRSHNRRRLKVDVEEDENSHCSEAQLLDEVPDLAYANYFFILITCESLQKLLPQVYNPHYIMNIIFYCGNYLLKQPEYVLVSKGLRCINEILRKVEIQSITHDALELNIYTDLFTNLSQVMIYCDSQNERKMALNIFQNYIERFDMRARHLVVLYLLKKTDHSGLKALIINIVKKYVIQSLEQNPCEHFTGKKLEIILKKICYLPHGSASNLVEISDEIIAALNLIRFLVIRDKTDTSGIWKIIKVIENDYMKPLRTGIDLARAHWKVKIKDLEEEKYKDSQKRDKTMDDITVSVGGENMPPMPTDEKIKFCHHALNALDIIESIAIRINECIEINFRCIRSLWTSRLLLQSQSHTDEEKPAADSASKQHESEEDYEKSIKTKILAASLTFIQELGWSQQAISAGAESIGYPGIIHGMFPNGGAELVQYFYTNCNAELNKILKTDAQAIQDDPCKPKKPPEVHVRDALETRLRMIVPYKSTWPQAIAIMTLPPNVPTALANLLTLVDDICYYAGDRSVDFNWYTRRIGLAGIYKMTELYLLQDNSEDHKQTWEFMERRIEDALQLQRVINVTSEIPPPDQAINRATDAAGAAFTTARNILGLNWNR